MNNASLKLQDAEKVNISKIEKVLIRGDLSALNEQERVQYVVRVCDSLGLNHLTNPFTYIEFKGKTKLYAGKDCTEQLRKIHGVSVMELHCEYLKETTTYIAKVKVQDKSGRTDWATGAIDTRGMTGEHLANALMKTETKAKRRATLSICGLGMLDESEIEPTSFSDEMENITPKDKELPDSDSDSEVVDEAQEPESFVYQFKDLSEAQQKFLDQHIFGVYDSMAIVGQDGMYEFREKLNEKFDKYLVEQE